MNKRARNLLTLVVALIIVLGGGYWVLRNNNVLPGSIVKDSGSNISDYSAVFLTNGQVYFGKIYSVGDSVDLRNIYYLQVNSSTSNLQSGTAATPSASPDISLVKLGNELHGPNDRMLINHQQVLFTESLKSDSKVVTAINNYTAGK